MSSRRGRLCTHCGGSFMAGGSHSSALTLGLVWGVGCEAYVSGVAPRPHFPSPSLCKCSISGMTFISVYFLYQLHREDSHLAVGASSNRQLEGWRTPSPPWTPALFPLPSGSGIFLSSKGLHFFGRADILPVRLAICARLSHCQRVDSENCIS